MSKVLVDRVELEEAAKWLEVHSSSSGSAEAFAAEALREAIAQPAEAEGVQLRRYTPISQGDHIPAMNSCDQGGWVRHSEHLAALSAERARADVAVADANDAERALVAVTAERDKIKADYEYLLKNAHSLNGALTNTERDRIAVTAERDRLREEVERIALENDGHDQRRIRWAEELKQLRAEVEALRKNAERYAHLKAAWDDDVLIGHLDSNVHPSDWDRVIDAAMAAKEA